MLSVVDTLWILIGGIVITILLGLVAGFSPTLYITQIKNSARSKVTTSYVTSIMVGVLCALVVLTALFQLFHLNTLLDFIDTTLHALLISVIFNILIGIVLIGGGAWYLNHKDLEKKSLTRYKKSDSTTVLMRFGLLRTFISISGVTATFIASNIIAEVSPGVISRLILTLIFLTSAVLPFVGILLLMKSRPEMLVSSSLRVKEVLTKLNYRPVIGVGAILFGSSIVIYNVLIAVFY